MTALNRKAAAIDKLQGDAKSGPGFLKRWALRAKYRLVLPFNKDRRLAEVKELIKYSPSAHSLLEDARAQGLAIRFNAALAGTKMQGIFVHPGESGPAVIELNPERTAAEIVPTLAHELRHYWQYRRLGLSPEHPRASHTDARTALALNRIKEADAYTFAQHVVRQVNRTTEWLVEAAENIRQFPPGSPDKTQERLNSLSTVFQACARREEEREPARMAATFEHYLAHLNPQYDREEILSYHACFTYPSLSPIPHAPPEHAVRIPDVRKFLYAGTSMSTPYLQHLSDARLAMLALKPVDPVIRRLARAMTAFEKRSAAQELTPEQSRDMRREIHQKIRALRRASPAF